MSVLKAIVVKQVGAPDVLQYLDVPDPEVKPTEILVQIRSVAINHFDLAVRTGSVLPPKGFPIILGSDGAGKVVEVGKEVKAFHLGDRALVTGGGLGFIQNGTYAELVSVAEEKAIKIPSGVTYDQAAATGVAYRTAWYALKNVGDLKQGERLLIQGGSSGVGTAALQLAKAWGSWVATTVGKSNKSQTLKSLGADIVLVFGQPDLKEIIYKATEDKGVDVVLELVGRDTIINSLDVAAKNARILLIGYLSGSDLAFSLLPIIQKEIKLIGVNTRKTDLNVAAQILEMISQKQLYPTISEVLPLEQASEAHRMIETRQILGRVLLHPF